MAPNIAVPQPLISKPFSTPAASLNIMAFTTNVKRPRVNILMGRVRRIRMGFNSIFKRPTIIEASNALGKDVILNPGTIIAVR